MQRRWLLGIFAAVPLLLAGCTSTIEGAAWQVGAQATVPDGLTAEQHRAFAALPVSPPAAELRDCDGRVVDQRDIQHPHLGASRLFLVNDASTVGVACIIGVTWQGESLGMIELSAYKDEVGFADPVTDATGNYFATYNPGRYNGVVVLVPTPEGFADVVGTYAGSRLEGGRVEEPVLDYYSAELVGPGTDDEYTIKRWIHDCEPDCASGAVTTKTLAWTGSAYAE